MSKNELSADQLAILNQGFPASDEQQRLQLPRLGMLSKDIIEESGTGKNKKYNVIQAAGTFYTERESDEIGENGRRVWKKDFIESETIDVTIVYHRRQLRKFDSSLEKFISSPIFDNADQVIPLYLDKQVIKRGTQAELQACYPALTQKGKPTSDLKEEAILYVVYEGELYQMNLSQSSKFEFRNYKRTVNPAAVITTLGSKEDSFGSNVYRKVTFSYKAGVSPSDFDLIVEKQSVVRDTAKSDAQFYLGSGDEGDDDLKKLAEEISGK